MYFADFWWRRGEDVDEFVYFGCDEITLVPGEFSVVRGYVLFDGSQKTAFGGCGAGKQGVGDHIDIAVLWAVYRYDKRNGIVCSAIEGVDIGRV